MLIFIRHRLANGNSCYIQDTFLTFYSWLKKQIIMSKWKSLKFSLPSTEKKRIVNPTLAVCDFKLISENVLLSTNTN